MTQTLEAFQQKFQISEMTIVTTQHWCWSLRPVHSTIGSGILSLNRYCSAFSDLTVAEAEDLAKITKLIEGTLHSAFQYNKINYIMLMMVDNHLHFHVIPRYDRAIEFAEVTWGDSGWPALPSLAEDQSSGSAEILTGIRNHLQERLPRL